MVCTSQLQLKVGQMHCRQIVFASGGSGYFEFIFHMWYWLIILSKTHRIITGQITTKHPY